MNEDDPHDDWTAESRKLTEVLKESANSDKRSDKCSDRRQQQPNILSEKLGLEEET